MLTRKNFIIYNRFFYIIFLRSLFLSYNYFIFLYNFVNSVSDFKIKCFSLNIKMVVLNSKHISKVFSNVTFFNFLKSKFILLYSLNLDIFNILEYIKSKKYLNIFSVSFKNYFINLKWIEELNNNISILLLFNSFFIIYYLFSFIYYLITYIFRTISINPLCL